MNAVPGRPSALRSTCPPVAERTVPAVLADAAHRRPGEPAITDGATGMTYAELWDTARRRAAALLDVAGGPGGRVLTMLDNHVDAAVTWLSLATGGLVEVPVNVSYHGEVLAQQIIDSGAETAVVDAAYAAPFAAAARGTQVRHLVVRSKTGEAAPGPAMSLHRFADLDGGPIGSLPPVTGGDPMAVMYTSGTTGRSKGVVVTHAHAYTYGAPQILGGADAEDTVMVALPLYHVGGQWAGLYNALIAGAGAYIAPRFQGESFWDEARRHGCTYVLLVIAMANHLYQRPPRPGDADNPFTRMFIAPVLPEAERFAERFGVEIGTGYGSTEAGTVFTAPFGAARPKACGWPRPGIQARIVGPDDHPVADGETGELVVRSDEPWTTMVEYLGRPEETTRTWRNLWYHTGDAMFVDSDGQYVYVDRLGDAIRRRGENVPSADVEAVLDRHPAILESAVVGIAGETEHEILAAVVLRPDARLDPADLVLWAAGNLPHFMVPRFIRIVAELDRTPSGKIRKRPLRESGIAGAWDRETAGIHVGRHGVRTAKPA